MSDREQIIEIDDAGKVHYPKKCGECGAPVEYQNRRPVYTELPTADAALRILDAVRGPVAAQRCVDIHDRARQYEVAIDEARAALAAHPAQGDDDD